MSCKDCLNRRDFLAKSALAAAAFVVVDGVRRRTDRPDRRDTRLGSLGEGVGFSGTRDARHARRHRTRACRRAHGRQRRFLGLSRICTHEGCEAAVDQVHNQIQCPCHGSVFSATGDVVHGPTTGESIRPLDHVNVAFDASSARSRSVENGVSRALRLTVSKTRREILGCQPC